MGTVFLEIYCLCNLAQVISTNVRQAWNYTKGYHVRNWPELTHELNSCSRSQSASQISSFLHIRYMFSLAVLRVFREFVKYAVVISKNVTGSWLPQSLSNEVWQLVQIVTRHFSYLSACGISCRYQSYVVTESDMTFCYLAQFHISLNMNLSNCIYSMHYKISDQQLTKRTNLIIKKQRVC